MKVSRVKSLNLFMPRSAQHPSSVSALRADPPSPTRGEGNPSAFKMTNKSICLWQHPRLSSHPMTTGAIDDISG
ncbi:MAG: hypothetical protein E5X67_36825 [Mesorhizobium sp.]|nr:MAG: hypothetical protein E5X67_36825 [Mesorhizobium sp.]